MGVATREAYGQALKELALDNNVVVLEADLGKATKVLSLRKLHQKDILIWEYLKEI